MVAKSKCSDCGKEIEYDEEHKMWIHTGPDSCRPRRASVEYKPGEKKDVIIVSADSDVIATLYIVDTAEGFRIHPDSWMKSTIPKKKEKKRK